MVILNGFPFVINSQEIDSVKVQNSMFEDQGSRDTIPGISEQDSLRLFDYQQLDSMFTTNFFRNSHDSLIPPDSLISSVSPVRIPFKPNPTKAVLFSAIVPGLGQIYNRKYWKLPIVYGGFMGFTYAITWNNKNLQDYGEAYKDLTFDLINYQDEPENWHQSWRNFLATSVDPASRFNENFKSQLKRGRDLYRRNRDLSIIMAVGFYLICMADAYVDAQLFDFDISPDLSLHIEPVVNPGVNHNPRLYGLNVNIKF